MLAIGYVKMQHPRLHASLTLSTQSPGQARSRPRCISFRLSIIPDQRQVLAISAAPLDGMDGIDGIDGMGMQATPAHDLPREAVQ